MKVHVHLINLYTLQQLHVYCKPTLIHSDIISRDLLAINWFGMTNFHK